MPLPPKPIPTTDQQKYKIIDRQNSTGFEVKNLEDRNQKTTIHRAEMESYERDLIEPNVVNDHKIISRTTTVSLAPIEEWDATTSPERDEKEDELFPLPENGDMPLTIRKDRGMKRNTTATLSVKDLSQSFELMSSKELVAQQQPGKKYSSNKEVVGGWRW